MLLRKVVPLPNCRQKYMYFDNTCTYKIPNQRPLFKQLHGGRYRFLTLVLLGVLM